jgi:hypothetical protein
MSDSEIQEWQEGLHTPIEEIIYDDTAPANVVNVKFYYEEINLN